MRVGTTLKGYWLGSTPIGAWTAGGTAPLLLGTALGTGLKTRPLGDTGEGDRYMERGLDPDLERDRPSRGSFLLSEIFFLRLFRPLRSPFPSTGAEATEATSSSEKSSQWTDSTSEIVRVEDVEPEWTDWPS